MPRTARNDVETEGEIDASSMAAEISKLSSELVLTEEMRGWLLSNPAATASIVKDTKDAIMLYRFRSIMDAMVSKAENGDTSAAKFVVDYAAPEVVADRHEEAPKWEELAITLRDRLKVELSAEILVEQILKAVSKWEEEKIRWLFLEGNKNE